MRSVCMSTATCYGVLVLVRAYRGGSHSLSCCHQTHVFPQSGRYSLELLPTLAASMPTVACSGVTAITYWEACWHLRCGADQHTWLLSLQLAFVLNS